MLAREMTERAERAHRVRRDWIRLADEGGSTVRSLAQMYTVRAYSQRGVREWDEAIARRLWSRMQPPLRWFKWLGKLQRRSRRASRKPPEVRTR
jgi:hypothetical protein